MTIIREDMDKTVSLENDDHFVVEIEGDWITLFPHGVSRRIHVDELAGVIDLLQAAARLVSQRGEGTDTER